MDQQQQSPRGLPGNATSSSEPRRVVSQPDPIVHQPTSSRAALRPVSSAPPPQPSRSQVRPKVAPLHQTPSMLQYPPMPGVPRGFEALCEMDMVFVEQEVELLEALTGWETSNRYQIKNCYGQIVYFAAELIETCGDSCNLACGGSRRPFKIVIVDPAGQLVLKLERPCDWLLFLSGCFFCCGHIGGEMNIDYPGGKTLGKVEHKFNFCQIKYDVTDNKGNVIMIINGPSCGDCVCCMQCCEQCSSREFPVTLPDGTEIGKVTKLFSGFKDILTKADNFSVTFPMDLHVKWKAIIMSAAFLLDFMYFESNQPRGRRHSHGRGFGFGGFRNSF